MALMHEKISARWMLLCILAVAFGSVRAASAQDNGRSNLVLDVAKSVLFDPTTYTPAALSYASERMDWNTSQPLFAAGWVEHNARYTVSGRPDDTPLSYQAGLTQIRRDALAHLQESVVNNLSAAIFDRVLTQRFPKHRKLFKALSWAERIGFSGYVGYLVSVDHFQQTQKNQEMAKLAGR